MAAEDKPVDGQDESEDVRSKALVRLGVAGLVTAAALAGLWWLDQGDKPVKPTTTPRPIMTAPLLENAPPRIESGEQTAVEPTAVEPTAGESTPGERPAGSEHPTATAATPLGEAPPPPRVSNTPKAALPAVPPRSQSGSASPPAAPTAPPPATPTGDGRGFVVQLGVFSNPEHARELVSKLTRQGIQAQMETRVQLGPFRDRQEAEKAQAEIRKLGIQGLVIPAAATR